MVRLMESHPSGSVVRSKVCLFRSGAIRYDEGNGGTHKPWSVCFAACTNNKLWNWPWAAGIYAKIKKAKNGMGRKIVPYRVQKWKFPLTRE